MSLRLPDVSVLVSLMDSAHIHHADPTLLKLSALTGFRQITDIWLPALTFHTPATARPPRPHPSRPPRNRRQIASRPSRPLTLDK
jgi:hypothetical protein